MKSLFPLLVTLMLCACTAPQPRNSMLIGGVPALENPPSEKSIAGLLRYKAALSHLEAPDRVALLNDTFDNYRTDRTALNGLLLALMMNQQAESDIDATLGEAISSLDPPLPAPLQVLARDLISMSRQRAKAADEGTAAQHEIAQLRSSLRSLQQNSEQGLQALRSVNRAAEAKIRAPTAIEQEITRAVASDVLTP
jgi:hypothetical protein